MIQRVLPSLEGRKALVVGIANEHSIGWGGAKWLRALGADVAVTYRTEKARTFVEPLAVELQSPIVMPLDVREPGQLEAVFARIAKEWGRLDTLVHSISFSPKGGSARPGGRRDARRLHDDARRVVLVLYPHGIDAHF